MTSGVVAIMPAAGRGARLGTKRPKPLVPLKEVPIFVRTLEVLLGAYPFTRVLVPADPACLASMKRWVGKRRLKGVEFIAGGRTRAESVGNALEMVGAREKIVLVHDAARPFVTRERIRALIRTALRKGACILASKTTATVKQTHAVSGRIRKTLDRRRIYLAQTPQVFQTSLLKEAYRRRKGGLEAFTDEASIVESLGRPVWVVEGPSTNIKITTPEDLRLAESLLGRKRV